MAWQMWQLEKIAASFMMFGFPPSMMLSFWLKGQLFVVLILSLCLYRPMICVF